MVGFVGWKVLMHPGGMGRGLGLGEVGLLVVWVFVGVVGGVSEVCWAVARGLGVGVGVGVGREGGREGGR